VPITLRLSARLGRSGEATARHAAPNILSLLLVGCPAWLSGWCHAVPHIGTYEVLRCERVGNQKHHLLAYSGQRAWLLAVGVHEPLDLMAQGMYAPIKTPNVPCAVPNSSAIFALF
jgi:hypothetical protein